MYSANTAYRLPEKVKKIVRSTLISRNVTVAGHRTSVRLEPDMWVAFEELWRRQRTNLHAICTLIANAKDEDTSLTAAIRVYIMNYYRMAASEEGHLKAGHGYNPGSIRAPATSAPQPQNQAMLAPQQTPVPSTRPQAASATASVQCKSSAPFMIGKAHMKNSGAIR